MQFSELWLRSFVSPALDSDALGHLLTMAGLEVEEQDGVAAVFSKVVVAQIVEAEKHPNADKLRVCKVDAGQGELLQIVCGAPQCRRRHQDPLRAGRRRPGRLRHQGGQAAWCRILRHAVLRQGARHLR